MVEFDIGMIKILISKKYRDFNFTEILIGDLLLVFCTFKLSYIPCFIISIYFDIEIHRVYQILWILIHDVSKKSINS